MNPISKKYELSLLARIISDKGSYYENIDTITSNLFIHYSDIFALYQKIYNAGRQPTLIKLLQAFPNLKEEFQKAIKQVDYSINVSEYVAELNENSRNIAINDALLKTTAKKTSEEKLQLLSELFLNMAGRDSIKFFTGYDVAVEIIKNIDAKKHIGINTGFYPFDKLTGGLQKTDLVIIAAEPSQGKTALALNIAENIIETKCSTLFISFEMSKEQLVLRLVCSIAEVPKNEILKNAGLYTGHFAVLKNQTFFVSDIGRNNLENVTAAIRTAKLRHGVQVVIIDYLQLITNKEGQSREQEVGQIARVLKNLAKELEITIVCLSQLSRPKVPGQHRPTMARLRDSGQIEEAADIIWFIYRPEVYGITEYEGDNTEGLAELIIAKGRNYGTGRWKTRFEAGFTKFRGGVLGYGGRNDESISGDAVPF